MRTCDQGCGDMRSGMRRHEIRDVGCEIGDMGREIGDVGT